MYKQTKKINTGYRQLGMITIGLRIMTYTYKNHEGSRPKSFMLGNIETSILIGYDDKQFEDTTQQSKVPWQAAGGQPTKST